jgi:hypothetical protein
VLVGELQSGIEERRLMNVFDAVVEAKGIAYAR